MTHEQETYYAILEAIQVMEHYDTGEDFALVSSLRRLKEIKEKGVTSLTEEIARLKLFLKAATGSAFYDEFVERKIKNTIV